MKERTRLIIGIIGCVLFFTAIFCGVFIVNDFVMENLTDRGQSASSGEDKKEKKKESSKEKDLYDEDKYIGFTYGGSGWGTWFDCAGGYVVIYNDGRAELYFEDEAVYETTVDIDRLQDKIDRDKLRTMKIKEDPGVCDGDSDAIYLYMKDGSTKTVGGYMVTNKGFNKAISDLYDAFEPGELGDALYDAKLAYYKKTGECTYIGSGMVDYVEEITGLQLRDLYVMAEGEIEIDNDHGYSEYAYIRISLFDGASDTIEERLAEQGGDFDEVTDIPGYCDHEIAQMLKSEDCEKVCYFFDDGWNGAKTRSMEMYLSTDEDGNEYLYFFG